MLKEIGDEDKVAEFRDFAAWCALTRNRARSTPARDLNIAVAVGEGDCSDWDDRKLARGSALLRSEALDRRGVEPID
jgi:hypothetical protein